MSSTTSTAAGAAAGTDTIVDLKGMWIGLVVLNVFYLIVRIYEQIYGWRAGLSPFAPERRSYRLGVDPVDGDPAGAPLGHRPCGLPLEDPRPQRRRGFAARGAPPHRGAGS